MEWKERDDNDNDEDVVIDSPVCGKATKGGGE
eukprot:CAMPEP_0170901374 /NCGR_PEP_ID=MMETSP0734-20130129/48386_1 /TAXON_ID=186038 /ORGANISM="Fragilariopsis kerguelensis, Strain L26-C5" /LENGTH=31 /DNA_ID= /DNA_START= /DNA_END= /DNA_ORIENTATION=